MQYNFLLQIRVGTTSVIGTPGGVRLTANEYCGNTGTDSSRSYLFNCPQIILGRCVYTRIVYVLYISQILDTRFIGSILCVSLPIRLVISIIFISLPISYHISCNLAQSSLSRLPFIFPDMSRHRELRVRRTGGVGGGTSMRCT